MESAVATRQHRALEAATSIAGAYGLPCGGAYVLNDSNNTIVHLAPSAIRRKGGDDDNPR
jgi:hypothetical protein